MCYYMILIYIFVKITCMIRLDCKFLVDNFNLFCATFQFLATTLHALGVAARALLEDAQERLVFRAHVHLRADVLMYRPAPGDLAYPDKLEMMEVSSYWSVL